MAFLIRTHCAMTRMISTPPSRCSGLATFTPPASGTRLPEPVSCLSQSPPTTCSVTDCLKSSKYSFPILKLWFMFKGWMDVALTQGDIHPGNQPTNQPIGRDGISRDSLWNAASLQIDWCSIRPRDHDPPFARSTLLQPVCHLHAQEDLQSSCACFVQDAPSRLSQSPNHNYARAFQRLGDKWGLQGLQNLENSLEISVAFGILCLCSVSLSLKFGHFLTSFGIFQKVNLALNWMKWACINKRW